MHFKTSVKLKSVLLNNITKDPGRKRLEWIETCKLVSLVRCFYILAVLKEMNLWQREGLCFKWNPGVSVLFLSLFHSLVFLVHPDTNIIIVDLPRKYSKCSFLYIYLPAVILKNAFTAKMFRRHIPEASDNSVLNK